jgi:hypothetical protein
MELSHLAGGGGGGLFPFIDPCVLMARIMIACERVFLHVKFPNISLAHTGIGLEVFRICSYLLADFCRVCPLYGISLFLMLFSVLLLLLTL